MGAELAPHIAAVFAVLTDDVDPATLDLAELTEMGRSLDLVAHALKVTRDRFDAAVLAKMPRGSAHVDEVGTVSVKPHKIERHDAPAAMFALAVRIFGDPDGPASPDEIPATVRALLSAIEDVLAANPKLRRGDKAKGSPGLVTHGLDPADYITIEWQDPKVKFTPAPARA